MPDPDVSYPPRPCPKCNRLLRAAGVAKIQDGQGHPRELAVYQCDECLEERDFGGEKVEMALTFAVDEKGQTIDVAGDDLDPDTFV